MYEMRCCTELFKIELSTKLQAFLVVLMDSQYKTMFNFILYIFILIDFKNR